MLTQHRMLVSDMIWKFTKPKKKVFTPKLRTWKLKDKDIVRKFQDELNNLLEKDEDLAPESVESKWNYLKTNLIKATELSCGLSKNNNWRKQT